MAIDLKQFNYAPPKTLRTKRESAGLQDLLSREISLFGNLWSAQKREAYYAELETLLTAGLDLHAALELIYENQTKKKDQELLQEIIQALVSGSPFYQAMDRTKRFSDFEMQSLRIAEESGDLLYVCKEMKEYFQRSIRFRRQLTGTLSYPVLVIGVAFLALVFLLRFLVPLFSDIYSRLDQDLPSLTKAIVQLSGLIEILFFPVLLSLLVFGFSVFFIRKENWFRKYSSKLMLHIPLFGPLIKKVQIGRFASSMAFLMQAKVPMTKALELTASMIQFYPIEEALASIRKQVIGGTSLFISLKQYSIFPRRMISLLKVGEEAGQLTEMFSRIAEQNREEVEQQTKLFGSLIEPVLIVFLALIVGLILVAMYLPIFKLVTNFG